MKLKILIGVLSLTILSSMSVFATEEVNYDDEVMAITEEVNYDDEVMPIEGEEAGYDTPTEWVENYDDETMPIDEDESEIATFDISASPVTVSISSLDSDIVTDLTQLLSLSSEYYTNDGYVSTETLGGLLDVLEGQNIIVTINQKDIEDVVTPIWMVVFILSWLILFTYSVYKFAGGSLVATKTDGDRLMVDMQIALAECKAMSKKDKIIENMQKVVDKHTYTPEDMVAEAKDEFNDILNQLNGIEEELDKIEE